MMRRFEGMRKAENLLFPALGLAIGALLAGGQYLAPREAGSAVGQRDKLRMPQAHRSGCLLNVIAELHLATQS